MGRIKKVAAERHTASLTSFISNFVQEAAATPLHQLPAKLDSFPQPWPFPRGDLYHWIPLLDRFDHILEIFNKEYGLDQGPQQQPFECRLLTRGDAEEGMPYPSTGAQEQELQTIGYSSEGDRELIESVVSFTKVLFEHCGNRSLYSSSTHVGNLLYTTSLSLLRVALRLGLRLAQRYQAARYKNQPHPHANLLAQHYNFNFENVARIAQPFPKPPQTASALSATPGKGKEKASHTSTYNPCDLVNLAKQPASTVKKADFGSVHLTYYEQSHAPRPDSSHQSSEAAPVTPTPTRRSSALGPSRDRPGIERSATGDVSATPIKSKEADTASSSAPKAYSITSAKVAETPAWALVREALSKVPKDSQYDVLNRIRIAKAFASPSETAQHLLEARLLAIANLFYGAGESKFQEKVGIPDSEEPKRFHLAHQLCDLLQPPTSGQDSLSLECETAVLYAIEAFSKMRHKSAEIADALQISQNHGVIYYELRKVISTVNVEPHNDKKLEAKESKWREATFDLTNALLQTHAQPKQGQLMVGAGIMSILIEGLTLRTARAERFHEKILLFFDSFIHGIQTAFQTLANIKGFEVLADLISYDVTSAIESVKDGNGLPADQKSKVIDYAIPFAKQATLRQVFKFVTHMYEHNSGNHDRLLRNFIDTPQVLGGLRNVIEQGNIFGANVWTAAVSIVSNFIHNEPTSFQVVSEAGLVKSVLQSCTSINLDQIGDSSTWDLAEVADTDTSLKYDEQGELQWPTASGILPVPEAMVELPNAFGAICLSESGMKFFKQSQALYHFMDIFVSRAHVTALEEDGSGASSIGQSFDELSRHHPSLKGDIVWVVIAMVKRVGEVCKYMAERESVGSKLYERTANGVSVAGGQHVSGASSTSTQQDDDRGKAMPFISACFKFLEGFFHNNGMCQSFCEQGGAIFLLDVVASASAPHDITSFPVWSKFAPVFKSMVEQKPHLVLPSLIQRTQAAIAGLKPLLNSQNADGAFSSYLDLSKPQAASLSGQDGTTVVKSLGLTNLLTQILGRALAPPPYHRAHTPQLPIFTQVNFTDIYIELVNDLMQLHAACIWENLILQKSLPEKWKGQTEPKPLMLRRINASGVVEIASETRWDAQTNGNGSSNGNGNANGNANGSLPDDQAEQLSIKNARTVRYLLNQTPHGVECFLHSLAQALSPYKRMSSPGFKQEAPIVADHLAKSLVWELDHRRFASADEATVAKYTVSVLTTCTRVLTKNSGADYGFSKEALTMTLNKFYIAQGFNKLNDILNRFCDVLASGEDDKDSALENCARDGLSVILNFYKEVARHKCITEATQSAAMSVRDNRQADYFMPGQFVVEIRDIVLPAVSKLWHSSALEKIGVNHAKTIIEIMRIILKGEGEDRAIKRSENATRRVQATKFEFKLRDGHRDEGIVRDVQGRGNDLTLAREAAFRCNSNLPQAVEYCKFRTTFERAPSFPIPGEEEEPKAKSPTPADKPSVEKAPASEAEAGLQRQRSVEMTDAGEAEAQQLGSSSRGADEPSTPSSEEADDGGDSFRIGNLPADVQDSDLMAMSGGSGRLQEILQYANGGAGSSSGTSNPSAGLPAKDTREPFVTVEDLDEKRSTLREDILERCLEILSAQKSITFELADLIQAAVAKSGDSASPRADIGSTLVSSLMSLQGEEPSEESGAKISAYAHLIALILQDQDFFISTLDELKEYFGSLVEWITLSPEQKMEDAPWVEMILLIIERVLTEDEQPPEVHWTPPPADDPLKPLPAIEPTEPVVEPKLKASLFDAVVDLLPKIGKNSSLALSAARVLVILTRKRDMAKRMSDRHSMSKLFVMIRQMAGAVNEKLQGAFMVILRHMIEDEPILRQIMQTEIRALFETHRTSRPMDTSTYARNLYHLVIRDPDLFVEVTKEMVEVARFDGNPNRGQTIALKKDKPATVEEKPAEAAEQIVKPTVEEGTSDEKKAAEVKPPTVETTDGVIQYLLRELSNYRDVEDKPPTTTKEQNAQTQTGESGDVDMIDASGSGTSNGQSIQSIENNNSKPEKPTFKAEENGIFIYRCFLMQCLSELLGSYTRTKVEFINFSRKAETQPATPAKPRSGTLNYLLNMLIPVGTLEHPDEIAHRKKISTSGWATTVVVSLCSRTSERQTPREMRVNTAKEENAELTFVQKFVLEHALRSFKEATTSSEALDARYSRLLALAELFNRLLSGKSDRNNAMAQEGTSGSSRQIGKLMYEKNFVSALTSAVAEIDLNFPNAKRAVKYLLNPLKQLTDLGLYLSQDSDFSSSAIGTSEEDEISSATSVSEDEDHDEREQTPDLYRNSTLGMFEAGRNGRDDSDSDSEDDEDDEDMYDDGYEEEMDYEEEQMAEHGDVVSDEDDDEEIEGMGDEMGDVEGVHGDPVDMDIEVVMDGEGHEMDSDDSDDEEDDEDDDDEAFGHDIDAMDEITGDDENASMGDDHDEEGEWEEDGGGFAFAEDEGGSPHEGPLEEIARVIGGGAADDTSDVGEQQDVVDLADGDEEYFDDEMPPEEDDEEEIDYGNDVIYEPEVEEDEEDEPGTQWDFDAPPPPAAILRGHHHHHHRHGGLQEMFALGMGGPPRNHRSTSNSRGDDDGTNPLLQREGAATSRDRDAGMDFSRFPRRPGMPRPGEALIQDLVATMGPGGTGTINISMDGMPFGGRGGPFMNGMFAIRGANGTQLLDIDPARLRDHMPRFAEMHQHAAHGTRSSSAGEEAQAVDFRPLPSVARWQEEAKMLFGSKHHEKALRILNALLRALVPSAMEAKRQADIEEAKRKMEAEAQKQKEEEERKAREEQEKKEREEREAREAEEKRVKEEAERQEAEARGESDMEGVEAPKRAEESEASEAVQQPEAGQSSTAEPEAPRVTTTIRGRTLDITNLGIDLEYLEALPEEMREEVIMTQFAEQRSQQAQSGEEPSEISREFLDALPPEIQRELIRSEAMDRRRREREEAQRQAREQDGAQAPQPEEMNNADFMATLDPALRQQILMDADEGVIAALPEEFQAEARVLGGDGRHRLGRIARPTGGEARIFGGQPGRAEQEVREASRQRRPIVQMLDKAGIATLLRLMFVSLHHRAKDNLHRILSDVCKNTQNRAEVISILLSILADGTVDVQAVERSFASLSLRAKQQQGPKTPATTPLKRTTTGSLVTPGAELSPLNIVQQCLSTLNALTNDNPRVPSFFLTEHETISSQKAKSAKKGKANEVRAAKFPLNALLALLDRKLITENTGVMETLASLLSRVTHPLTMLLKRQKAAEEAEKKKAEEAEKKDGEGEGESSRPQTAGGDVQMGEASTEEAAPSADSAHTEPSAAGTAEQSTIEQSAEAAEGAPEQETPKTSDKKRKDPVPPEVPQENLRSVVNIITARECPAKTFSDTLDLIKNLSNLPAAKEIFGRELVNQAQQLSKAVLVELEDLAKQINTAQTGTDMQGLALTKFSSSASKQTKLLRVLVALDHLFDPQRTPELPSSGEDMSSLKQDVLAALHDSSTFDKLWANLSQCLTAIRNKGNMVNVAAILLPMIEALLVVCRNSTSIKDQPAEPGSPLADTPTTEAKLESLFFKFTEEHRKILNELIRNNPKLMHGNLAVLAKNSKVLEFDNKRNYFNRKVHDRREQRVSHPSLQLNVRREQVFLDSFKSLYYKTGDEIKYGKLNIRFHGEEGIDAGGVSREWFAAMARQIFNPDYALFNPVASDRTTFHPNEFSDVNPEHLMFFRFIGRIIGKALYEGRLLDCHFSRAVYRKILGKTVSLKDLESLELDHYKSLVWVLENDITDIITETFSIEVDRFGEKKIVDLKPNGRNIEVTEENKQEWVRLIVEHKLIKSVEKQLEEFLAGFHDIIPAELISIFNEQELELLISGLPDIDVDDWKNNTEYHNYQATSPQIQWFWRAVRSFDKEEKAKLLQFVTGTSKVPLNGFKELEGMNGFAKFNVHRDYSSKEKLPSSHTCFNQLDLPEYESYEHLRQQLYTAITAGSEYFGFA